MLAYINAANRPDHRVCAIDQQFYMNNYGAVPLWPYPSYGQRSIFANTRMTDIRKGSKWSNHVVAFVEKLMRERKVDGVFLDVLGARPWGISNWTAWSQTERNAWTDGAVDLVRRIDAKRRAINPNFIVVNNNIWSRSDGSTRGLVAERYVDGVSIEHPQRHQQVPRQLRGQDLRQPRASPRDRHRQLGRPRPGLVRRERRDPRVQPDELALRLSDGSGGQLPAAHRPLALVTAQSFDLFGPAVATLPAFLFQARAGARKQLR